MDEEPAPLADEPQPGAPEAAAAAVLDDQGVVIAWNDAASELLGFGVHDVLGRPAGELLAQDLPDDVRRRIADRREWAARARLRRRSDGEVQLHLQAFPLAGARSSTRWLVQAALQAPTDGAARPGGTSLLKEWALDQLAIPVAICDAGLRLVAVNRQMSAFTGRSETELLSGGMEDIAPAGSEHLEGVAQLAGEVLRTGVPLRHTVRGTGADGDGDGCGERLWSMSLSPLAGRDDQVRALSVAFLDMTQQAQAKRRLAIVNDAGDRIGRTLDVTETAQELADVGLEFADFVTVDLLDAVLDGEEVDPTLSVGRPLVFRRVAHASVLPGSPEAVIPPGEAHAHAEDSPPGRALRAGRSYRHAMDSPEVREWLERLPARIRSVREHGLHTVMGVPLIARGTTLGMVQFFRHRTRSAFDGDDLLLAQEIAARASVCVDNARRFARERTTALALQRSLLPRLPRRLAAVEVAARYLPANAGVGGDWFDVIPLSGARVALVVGDVVGHGVSAAAAMGRLSTAVRTLADMELPPEELLTHLDDLVVTLGREPDDGGDPAPSTDTGSTCLYAVYDPLTASCSMARAGHPPPALVTPDGTVEFPELPSGPPLGVGGMPFETVRLQVPEGSLLAFYTNGVIGAADGDVDVGLGNLRDALHRHTGSLEQTCDSVVAAILSDRPADDLALLLTRTRTLDASQVATWEISADPSAVPEARRQISQRLAEWGLDDLAFTTELIGSELVTNAIRYGGEPLQLRLIREASLTCEVADSSGVVPRIRRARVFDEGGRGLLVVSQLADRWGSRHTDEGKIIWAEQFLGER